MEWLGNLKHQHTSSTFPQDLATPTDCLNVFTVYKPMRWPSLLPDLTLPTDPHEPTEESQLLRILHKFNPALAYKYIGIPVRRNFLQVCLCIEIHSVCHQYFQPHSFCSCSFDLIHNPGTKGSPAQRGSGSLASGSTVFRSWQDGTCSSGCTRLYYSERCCTSHPQRFFKFNALNYAEYHIPSCHRH